ncbi:MAG: hypothetical protein IPM85_10130 [Chitinophagaceae bacterium]|nr:hypothetical protein [Chitinophagaceae bacterium]
MKKIMKNSRVIAMAFITVFSLSASAANNPVKDKANAVPAQLSHIGNVEEKPLVLLQVDGDVNQNDFTVAITDNMGQILYKEKFKGESFTKKFLFNTEEIGEATLYFSITCHNTKKTAVYELSNRLQSAVNFAVVKK